MQEVFSCDCLDHLNTFWDKWYWVHLQRLYSQLKLKGFVVMFFFNPLSPNGRFQKISIPYHSFHILTPLSFEISKMHYPHFPFFCQTLWNYWQGLQIGPIWLMLLQNISNDFTSVLQYSCLQSYWVVRAVTSHQYTSTPYVGWVCCWLSPLLWEVFLWLLQFSPLLKNQHL